MRKPAPKCRFREEVPAPWRRMSNRISHSSPTLPTPQFRLEVSSAVTDACCTYCSIEVDSSPGSKPAIERWATSRVKQAERIAKERNVPLLLLTARDGLLDPGELVSPGGATLGDDEIARHARRVGRQLEERRISQVLFLVNPSSRSSLAYLRLIVLACGAKVQLELCDHRRPFPDWSKVFTQAEQARLRVANGRASVEEAFGNLFRKHEDDGMVWFKRAQAYQDLGRAELALSDYERAAALFRMEEWQKYARDAVMLMGAHRKSSSSGDDPSLNTRLEALSRLQLEPNLERLSREAMSSTFKSPTAAVSLCRTALIRIVLALDPQASNDQKEGKLARAIKRLKMRRITLQLAEDMDLLRQRRNDVEWGTSIASRRDAVFCTEKLLEILREIYPRR